RRAAITALSLSATLALLLHDALPIYLRNQLMEQSLGKQLLLPSNMFRSGEDVFLDDVTKQELERTLQVSIRIVKSSGQDLIDARAEENTSELQSRLEFVCRRLLDKKT